MKKQDRVDSVIKKIKTKQGLASLSYMWILCFIPVVLGKDEFVKFHAKQGLVLFFVEVALILVGWIPIIGWSLIIATIIFSLLGIRSALNNEMWEMPYINKLAKKINL
jgi:fumarate reductase subunit D